MHNTDVHTNSEAGNIEQDWTLQRYLQDEGYQTAIFGKFFNGWNVWMPPAHWDKWGIWGSYVLGDDYYPTVNDQGTVRSLYSGTPTYESHFIRDKAVDFLARAERDDSRPWLLYLTPKAPHPPATPEPKYARASVPALVQPPSYFESDISDKPDWLRQRTTTPASIQSLHDKQLRTLKSIDDMVYRVFTELQPAWRGRRHAGDLRLRQRFPVGRTRPQREERAVQRVDQGALLHALAQPQATRACGRRSTSA